MMKQNVLKLELVMIMIILFASCKSSESEQKKTKEKQEGNHLNVERLFVEMDVNKDGKLSMSEVKGPLKNDFEKIDEDNDGFLSKEELEKTPKPEIRGRVPRPRQ